MRESKQIPKENDGKRIPRLPSVLWPKVPRPSESERLVNGEFTRGTTSQMLLVTSTLLIAVRKRSDGARAIISAIASVSTLESSIFIPLLEALARAGSGRHAVRSERVRVESALTGVVSVAALMDIAFVIVVAAGRCGLWWVGGSHWGFDVLSVDVDHAFTAANLGGIAGAGLGAFANVEEVLVDKGVAAVLGNYESKCKTRREKEDVRIPCPILHRRG